MTLRKKEVKRETEAVFRDRNLIVGLKPSCIVLVKEKGCRLWYEVTVEDIYSLGAKKHAKKIAEEKKKRREEGGCKR